MFVKTSIKLYQKFNINLTTRRIFKGISSMSNDWILRIIFSAYSCLETRYVSTTSEMFSTISMIDIILRFKHDKNSFQTLITLIDGKRSRTLGSSFNCLSLYQTPSTGVYKNSICHQLSVDHTFNFNIFE